MSAAVGSSDGGAAPTDCETTFGATTGLLVGFLTTGIFADVGTLVFVAFGAAAVDFVLLVAFLISGALMSTSIGSGTIFFGLPLFFTITSADMLEEVVCEECWRREVAK